MSSRTPAAPFFSAGFKTVGVVGQPTNDVQRQDVRIEPEAKTEQASTDQTQPQPGHPVGGDRNPVNPRDKPLILEGANGLAIPFDQVLLGQ